MKLFNFWRSSSSWRVRIALAHKQISYEYVPVGLSAGIHRQPEHLSRNPTATVPVLEVEENGQKVELSQSVAIVEYLEETFPKLPLFPRSATERAHVRALAEIINSGIQPFQNLQTLNYVKDVLKADQKVWAAYWIEKGMIELEKYASAKAGTHLFGNSFTWADCCLVPQMYGARRFGADTDKFPLLTRIEKHLLTLDAVHSSRPDAQIDAQPA